MIQDEHSFTAGGMHGKTHRELYPEQYVHPLIGKAVVVKNAKGEMFAEGILTRVVQTRFGPLAILNGVGQRAYSLCDVQEK